MTRQQFQPEDPQIIQRRVGRARERLLGGRGPGAGPRETARWMRDRPTLGGQPAATSRARVTEQALLARGDPADLTQLAARHSALLAVTIDAARIRLTRAWKHARMTLSLSFGGAAIVFAVWSVAHGKTRHRAEGRSARNGS